MSHAELLNLQLRQPPDNLLLARPPQRLFREHESNDVRNVTRHIAAKLTQVGWRRGSMRRNELSAARGFERRTASEQLEQDYAQRVDICRRG